ncbi:MAG: 3-hydroxyacyl-CoA dehydrogenase family protein, partial [Pseudomonadota bacterium]
LNKSEIAKRCVAQMLNEAVRCLDDGIIASPRDGDIGAIFGIGFPPFLGGPFSYMDKLGAAQVSSEMATFANYNPIFTPCDTLKAMAEKGGRFYQAESEEPAVVEATPVDPVEVTKEVVEDEQASEDADTETTKS